MDELSTIAHVIFGGEVRKHKEKFYTLQKQLRQAHMAQSYEVYASVAYLISMLVGFAGALIGVVVALLILGMINSRGNFTNIHMPETLAWLTPFTDIIIIFLGMSIMAVLGYYITYTVIMLIPAINASDRKSKINKQVPYAVTFMYALSKGGMNIITILRALNAAESTYGEVSREIGIIIRDMDYFGNDLRTAIINCINQTPSDMLQDLLTNLLSVIDSGGDVTAYLYGKTDQYLQRLMQDQKSFLEILGLIAESYVTAFVAGPLFIIIMSSVMTIMSGGSPTLLYVIIYGMLPLGSIMFIILISMLTPTEEEATRKFEIEKVNLYDTVPIEESGLSKAEERKMIEKIKAGKKALKLKEFLANPLGPIQEKPELSLIVSVPIAILFVGLYMALTAGSLSQAMANVSQLQHSKVANSGDPLIIFGPVIGYFDDIIVFFLLIVMIPLAIFFERKTWRERRISAEMPDFLKKLASTNETGMTLTQSIALIANANFGTISREVQKVYKNLQWGIDVNTALKMFANSLNTALSTRVITLITKAAESSGDIRDVLNVAANDAKMGEQIRKERSDGMLIYVVIIFISYCVFIYCVYTLSSTFIPVMASAGSHNAAATGGSASLQGATFIQSFNPDDYKRLFFHAAIIQGLFAGILAGVMGEGRWMSGLKYAIIMMIISYLMFALFI
ncbi:putative type II secretion system protein F [Methanocella conradii HZ254]|uniref:Type II secretion system protein F n=1 Tax=Methanocella conradii (strain DSM 24694 / JCM 17849 / CGMCC 1.5162 / HZ254) TaxID=1041930 RepID=H8I5X1_METCZ|nr:type II secretion system F family protein [Methanocella conradii]AFC99788.1 putative type II secretion system protein F [Methanocella conradii HZ254]